MDQGGEQLALRYDHTVPLARYLAMQGGASTQSKLWQVGKVYRRDNAVMNKGRMREFTQADFDVTGTWGAMIPDAEILSLLHTILTKLDVGEFTFKVNHRRILDGIFEVWLEAYLQPSTSSTSPWAEVKLEMTEEKGLDPAVADKIGEYVMHKGGPELLSLLEGDAALTANPSAKQGLSDMRILFTLLKAYSIIERISFDMSLARGLDYYTRIIYEAIAEASAPPGFKAANAFTSAPSSESTASPASASAPPLPNPRSPSQNQNVLTARTKRKKSTNPKSASALSRPADGTTTSSGLSSVGPQASRPPPTRRTTRSPWRRERRVSGLALVWPKWVVRGARAKGTTVYVMSAGDGLLEERVRLVKELRDAGFKTDFFAKSKPKIAAQFAAGERDEVPFAVILGVDEVKAGLVTVKEQRWQLVDGKKVKIESADKGTQVKHDELVNWLKKSEMWGEWEAGI